MPIKLPDKIRPPLSQSPNVLLLYGASKQGKSSSVTQLEDNLVFDLERGCTMLSGLIIDVPKIAMEERLSQLNVLRKYYNLLSQNGNSHYRFFTFDGIDVLEDLLIEEVSKKHGVSHISELAYGRGDSILRDEFFNLINAFKNLGSKIILIGHRRRSIIGESGAEVVIKELDLRGKLRNMAMSHSDAIGYVFSSNGQLNVSFKTGQNEDVAAGSRCSYLANKVIVLGEFNGNGELVNTHWDEVYPELSRNNNNTVKL